MTNGLKWWDHQRAWLDDSSRFRLCLKARQCGMSTVVAADAIRRASHYVGTTRVIRLGTG